MTEFEGIVFDTNFVQGQTTGMKSEMDEETKSWWTNQEDSSCYWHFSILIEPRQWKLMYVQNKIETSDLN